jgi:hypothetical protein
MSTLQVTNIKKTGETASRDVSGVAAAWVQYTPASATILDSVNVASLTDNGTGDTSVSFTSSMASSNYAQIVAGSHSNVTSSNIVARPHSTPSILAGSTRVSIGYTVTSANFTAYDYPYAATTIHGDLA